MLRLVRCIPVLLLLLLPACRTTPTPAPEAPAQSTPTMAASVPVEGSAPATEDPTPAAPFEPTTKEGGRGLVTPTPATGSGAGTTVRVLADYAVQGVLNELAADFEAANPGTDVVVQAGDSLQIAEQVAGGAAADVVALAGDAAIEQLVEAGRLTRGAAQVFTASQIGLIASQRSASRLGGPQDLLLPRTQIVAPGADDPLGAGTRALLTRLDESGQLPENFGRDLEAKLAAPPGSSHEVIREVMEGELDAAFVYSSELSDGVLSKLRVFTIPTEYGVSVNFLIAPMADAQAPDLAQRFAESTLSDEAQATFEANRFILVR